MGYQIVRTHEICAGHRIVGHEGRCAHLHGHGYIFEFAVEPRSHGLDALGRVVDFSIIKAKLCQWLEDDFDHKMILWCEDPMLVSLSALDPDGVCIVGFNPTAENLARHMIDVVGPQVLKGTGTMLVSCTVRETSKCSATYSVEVR